MTEKTFFPTIDTLPCQKTHIKQYLFHFLFLISLVIDMYKFWLRDKQKLFPEGTFGVLVLGLFKDVIEIQRWLYLNKNLAKGQSPLQDQKVGLHSGRTL